MANDEKQLSSFESALLNWVNEANNKANSSSGTLSPNRKRKEAGADDGDTKMAAAQVVVAVDVGATNTRVVVVPYAPVYTDKTNKSAAALVKKKHVHSEADMEASHGACEPVVIGVIKFQLNSASMFYQTMKLVEARMNAVKGLQIVATVASVPGPVTDNDCLAIANFKGGPSEQQLLCNTMCSHCPSLFPAHKTILLNDLQAGATGILALNSQHNLSRFFELLWDSVPPSVSAAVTPSSHVSSHPQLSLQPHSYVLVNVGTGLGNALLLYSPSAKGHIVGPLEGGHTTVALSVDSGEEAFLSWVSKKIYGTKGVEWDDLCSGRGIQYCYEWLALQASSSSSSSLSKADNNSNRSLSSTPSSAEIASTTASNKLALQAMLDHYKWVFRFAQNLCATTQARGLILAGDNQVHNDAFVTSHLSTLQREFLSHSAERMQWMSRIAVWRQVDVLNLNITGALHVARHL